MSLSPADLKQLQAAKNLLENPGLTAQLTSLLGTPIEYGLKKLPRKVNEKLGSVIEGALLKVARSATATLQENASGQPANRLHTLGAAVYGGVGGFFGPLAMLVEVPVTTGIIFRSIADIARSEGESIRDMDTLMACIEVFALGGKSASDDASESGYYAVRTALAQQVKAAADFLGKDAGSKKAAPMLLALVRKVAERLVEAQSAMAMLTTFNEVNMKPIMDLRSKYKDLFEKKHNGVRLGFMSFFVKAATEALKRFPGVNASIDGNDIVYHGYQDIGVAVSSDRGLVVPVLRNAEFMSLAEIEGGIANFGKKAKEGKLTIEDMTGGTFTISNGGVFGSLLSTPIVNPPQTAILGMHKIQERPMAVNGQVVILPMMYLALSYDHRLIDGKEAVSFLVAIKDLLEDPARLLLDV